MKLQIFCVAAVDLGFSPKHDWGRKAAFSQYRAWKEAAAAETAKTTVDISWYLQVSEKWI